MKKININHFIFAYLTCIIATLITLTQSMLGTFIPNAFSLAGILSTFLLLNIIHKKYGYRSARYILYFSLLAIFLLMLFSLLTAFMPFSVTTEIYATSFNITMKRLFFICLFSLPLFWLMQEIFIRLFKTTASSTPALSLFSLNALCYIFLMMTILFQNRIIIFGPVEITGALFVYPFSYFILDLIAEIYGYKAAQQTLWLSLIGFIIVGFITYASLSLSTLYSQDPVLIAIHTSLHSMLKIAFIDGYAILIGQWANIYAITRLKILVSGRFFALRSATSTIIGDTITCILAVSGVLMTQTSVVTVINIIFAELLVMFIFGIVLAIPGSILVDFIRRKEGIVPNLSTPYHNPFLQ